MLSLGGANAATCPPIGVVTTLMPPAELMITQIDVAFDAYDQTIALSLKSAFGNIQSAVTDVNMRIAQNVLEANHSIMRNNVEVQRLSSELKMNHKSYLERVAARENTALLTTSTDSVGKQANREYFTKLCELKKTSNSAFNETSRGASLSMTRNEIGGYEFSADGALLSYQQSGIVNTHYENFCTESDKNLGLCDETAKIPNADLLSFVFLRPMNEENKGVVKSIGMKTEYTYSDYEMSAAKSYIEHVVPLHSLKKPPIGTELSHSSIPYTARFKQLTGMNNLARFAFSKAYNNRVPVVNTGTVRLSKLDQIRVMLTNAKTTDMTAVTNSNAKGKMVFVLGQHSLENMLDQEIASLEKLNNNLLAALLAEENNTRSIINDFKSKRR